MLSTNRNGEKNEWRKAEQIEGIFFFMKRFRVDFFSFSCRNLRQHREMGIFSIFSHNQATFSIHFADFESSLASYVSIFQPLIPDLHLLDKRAS